MMNRLFKWTSRNLPFLIIPSLILHFKISEYKRYRSHIKKKSDQVLRLRKKAKKDVRGSNPGASLTDPSVQRLIEQTSRDLNNHYKQLSDHEKKCLRRILTEERHRYCNLVASLVCFICNPSTKLFTNDWGL